MAEKQTGIYDNCDWCNQAGATHPGGIVLPSGQPLNGIFCNKICFDRWSKWKSVLFSSKLKNKNLTNFPAETVQESVIESE
jgi:hypothetical protein